MEKYESILRFIRYEVNRITFKKNEHYKSNEEGSIIDLKIKPIVEIKNNEMNINLKVNIFKDAEKNNRPFEMEISLIGYFRTEGCNPEDFKANAIAILYPYVRAIVSTYTANANITPLILPAINVNKLIKEEN